VRSEIAVGQTRVNREEPTPSPFRTDACAARRASTLPNREASSAHQKRKGVAASVPARIKGPGQVARTS
jgi:hypothetical protein